MTQTFAQLGLSEDLTKALTKLGFESPTPIQEKTIPFAMQGRDILGSAQTGTGKTGAFGIPMVNHLLENEEDTAIVVTPTRELAAQVQDNIKGFLPHRSGINTCLLIGGDSMHKQLKSLSFRPRIIVGTPGRINDHLNRRSLKLNNCHFLVLDETDRMLDMGFSIQIEEIVSHMPAERQTLLFSATLPKNIMSLAKNYLNNPERIAIGATTKPAENIDHQTKRVTDAEKYDDLLGELSGREGSIIMFVKTKYGTERMADKLKKEGFKAAAIHGDLRHNKRERVTDAFRKEKYQILVATDVAARGLDIPHIQHVINYDLPQCPEDYIHRIGRTARAGATGHALAYITKKENGKWKAIERLVWGGETSNAPTSKPRKERTFQDRKAKSHRKGGYGAKDGNRESYGDKKRSFGDRDDRRSFKKDGERKSFRKDGERSFEKRDFGDKREFGNKRDFGDKKRSFGDRDGNRSFGDKKRSFGDRDGNRSFGDKKRSFGDRDGNRSFGDKKRSFGDRDGNRSFGDKKRSFGDRDGNRSFGDKKRSFGGRDDNRSFGEDRSESRAPAKMHDKQKKRMTQTDSTRKKSPFKKDDGARTYGTRGRGTPAGKRMSGGFNKRDGDDRSSAGNKPFKGKGGSFKGSKGAGSNAAFKKARFKGGTGAKGPTAVFN